MQLKASQARAEIAFYLDSLKRVVDSAHYSFPSNPEVDSHPALEASLVIERARLSFKGQARTSGFPIHKWSGIRDGLVRNLVILNEDVRFRELLRSILMRPLSRNGLARRIKDGAVILERHFNADVTISGSIATFIDDLESMEIIKEIGTGGGDTLEELAAIVPAQQIAPARFSVVDSEIRILERPPAQNKNDRQNISSALEHIREFGEELIETLVRSNCDPRLTRNVQKLQSHIIENGNIVRVGLLNMACGALSKEYSDELPDSINGMLVSHVSSISLYVAQFPEWEKFTHNAAGLEIREEDYEELREGVTVLNSSLDEKAYLTHPEVPRTIRFLNELISEPATATRRAFYATVRTVENLVSAIIHFAFDTIRKVSDGTSDAIGKVAPGVIVGMLTLALVGAAQVGPAASTAGAPWVQQAVELLMKQIDALK